MIVKVQVPIMSTDPSMPAMIYNKDRKVMVQMPMSPEIRKMMGNDLKRYFRAKVNEQTKALEFFERVSPQDW